MKPAVIIGALLIIVGIAGLAFGGFSFTHKEKVLDLGPIEASADKKESLPVPPILGALAIVGGVVLLATSARRA
jgi:drug/metabolite transporter (DMT)-like permease